MTPRGTRGVQIIGLLSLIGLTLTWVGCGESQEKSATLQRSVGGAPEGAPLGPMIADTGILQDATVYSPVKVPGGEATDSEPVAAAGESAAGLGSPEQQALLEKFGAALQAGNVEDLLALYEPSHVALLVPHVDKLGPSFEKLVAFTKAVEAKVDPAKAAELMASLPGGVADAQVEVIDPDHATLAGNPGILIFGPTRPDMQMQLARVDGTWRLQLTKPLEAAEVDAILAFHDQMQKALDRLLEWVARQTTIDPAQLQAAAMAVAMGQALELPEPEAEAEAEAGEEAAPGDSNAPQPSRGRRGPRSKSGS